VKYTAGFQGTRDLFRVDFSYNFLALMLAPISVNFLQLSAKVSGFKVLEA
jgi:hypothetical protein